VKQSNNIVEIEQVAQVFPGAAKNVYSRESDTMLKKVLVLKGSNVDQEGRISTENMESGFLDEDRKEGRYMVQEGDVITMARGTAVRVGMVTREVADKEIIATANFIIIRPDKNKIRGEVIFAYLQSEVGSKQLQALSTGAVIQHIPASSLKKLEIPVPSIEKQEKITDLLKAVWESRQAVEALIAQQRRTVDATVLSMMA